MIYVLKLNFLGQMSSIIRADNLRDVLNSLNISLDDNSATWLLNDLRASKVCALNDYLFANDNNFTNGIFLKEMAPVENVIAYIDEDEEPTEEYTYIHIEPIAKSNIDTFVKKNSLVDFVIG